jgi:membrane protein
MKWKNVWLVLKDAGEQWLEDKAPRLGAALAYYAVFSLAPLLVITIGIAGLVFGDAAAQGKITTELDQVVGTQGGQAIRAMLESANKPETGLLGSILGLVMLILGAGAMFGQLQDALDTIWKVKPKPGGGIWGFIRQRFLSFSMVLGVAFLLLVSLVVSAGLTALGTLIGAEKTSVWGLVMTTVLDLTVITILFALIFRFLPDAEIAWRDVWLGAFITSALFSIGKLLIGLYLGNSGVATGFGAVGSLAVLLVWLYYSAQIFLFGVELTKSYAIRLGSGLKPKANAVMVTDDDLAMQGLPRWGSRRKSA